MAIELGLPTIEQTAARLRAREISSTELTTTSLAQAEREQATINAFITLTPEVALAQAAEADRLLATGGDDRPLLGIPVAVKDLFETKGTRTTYASRMFADFVPDRDADVVRYLRAAGAVSIGKLNMDEFA